MIKIYDLKNTKNWVVVINISGIDEFYVILCHNYFQSYTCSVSPFKVISKSFQPLYDHLQLIMRIAIFLIIANHINLIAHSFTTIHITAPLPHITLQNHNTFNGHVFSTCKNNFSLNQLQIFDDCYKNLTLIVDCSKSALIVYCDIIN